jgi:hypothetical protein
MKWVEVKMKELGVLGNPDYKITCLLDHAAMVTVQVGTAAGRGGGVGARRAGGVVAARLRRMQQAAGIGPGPARPMHAPPPRARQALAPPRHAPAATRPCTDALTMPPPPRADRALRRV